jgi:type III pantothenate kinase
MIICLDIGNTHIYGGAFVDDVIKLRFRYPSKSPCTSDIFGLFLIDVIEKNQLDPSSINAISIGSVVPELNYSIIAACKKYFSITPLILQAGVKTGLKISNKNPLELGADRIANAIAATHHFPKKNIIVVDFGTATTICAISNEKTYLGGAIFAGFKLSMKSLSTDVAKLLDVDIVKPESPLGKTTATNIQSGLFFGQLGAVKEMVTRITESTFQNIPPLLIATGGYAHLFESENYFSAIIPDLVLHGLRIAWEKNS